MKPSKSNVIRLKSHVMPSWNNQCDHDVGSSQKSADSKLYEFVRLCQRTPRQQVMPDDHSEVVPLLPIPNRTVKRLCADDSAGSRVKVGHRQALTKPPKPPVAYAPGGLGFLGFVFSSLVQAFSMPSPVRFSAPLFSSSVNSSSSQWRYSSGDEPAGRASRK